MSSEVQSRPAASRGSRGAGRGGRSSSGRGGSRTQTRNAATNGDAKHDADSLASLEDEGEIGELKRVYGAKTSLIKEMFPDWSDVDILFALKETDGDENLTVTRIAEGSISQWGEVSKPKKERAKTKGKENTFTTTTGDAAPASNNRSARGGRTEGGRGRGRATERGARATRAKSTRDTNGARFEKNQQLSVPTEDSNAWDNQKSDNEASGAWDNWGSAAASSTPADTNPAPVSTSKPTTIPDGTAKTWASMLRQSTAPKPVAKPKETPASAPRDAIEPLPPAVEATPPAAEPHVVDDAPEQIPDSQLHESSSVIIPEIALPPSKDELTETNLEQLRDDSHPVGSETLHSEAADSWDPRAAAVSATATPLSAAQQQHLQKAPTSGYATTAMKATERLTTRTPSYTRRILDQEEAVRMPGNREVDRTTVQFGALNFAGMDEDIDGDREEPETRAQPPDDSPIAHPRAALPPTAQPAQVPEAHPTQKPATTLAQPSATPGSVDPQPIFRDRLADLQPVASTAPASQQPATAQAHQSATQTSSFGRFGQGSQDQSFGQKPFDSFAQQSQTSTGPSQFDNYQGQQQAQAQSQQAGTAFSSAPNDYSSYYTTADAQGRNQYNNYYNQNYNQQHGGQTHGQAPQEAATSQPPRSFSGYTAPPTDNLSQQYPQSVPSRYGANPAAAAGDAQNSGNTTPNPATQGQQGSQNAQSQTHGQQQHGGYPFNHPYYSNPYYNSAYASHYQNNFGGFGGPYGKGGYGQQHPYAMSPQGGYDHATTQGSGFSQSSLHRENSGVSSGGLGEYGRAGSAQSGNQAGFGASGFGGGMHDSFGRGGSSYQSQSGQGFGAQASQTSGPSANDDLKPFGDGKGAAGPSPSLGGARPGSATNTGASQASLPPPQASQQGMGGYGGGAYPSHHQQGHAAHGNQSSTGAGYGMGAGGAQSHGNNPYGGYGNQSFGGNNFYGNQPRGWGGNYH